jgi:AcrR family transcriptional regulator
MDESATQPLDRDFPLRVIREDERRRITKAVAESAREHGADLTASQVIAAAPMPRNRFYLLFRNKDDCVKLACEEAAKRILDPVKATLEVPRPWLDRMGGAVEAFLATAAEEPLLAELCLVHAIAIGGGDSCHELATETLVATIRGGREAGREARGPAYRDPPPQIEELLAGGIIAVVALRLRRGEVAGLASLRGELVTLVVTPFFGLEEAGRFGHSLEAV